MEDCAGLGTKSQSVIDHRLLINERIRMKSIWKVSDLGVCVRGDNGEVDLEQQTWN
jgi:hypothetical protein